MTAFGGTGGVFFGMATLATVIKRDLSAMGKFLFVGAVMLLVAGIVNIFLQSSALMITLSVLAIGIFSAFMLYDLKRVIDGGETNYITATLASTWTSTTCSRACWRCSASSAASATERASASEARRAPAGPFFLSSGRSKTAMLSTCAVCGNMLTTPAAVQR